MKSRPTDQSDAERAVMAFKHQLAVKVMAFILTRALNHPYVFPGDVPEDIVEKEHRQGVVSNAWGSLDSLELIELLPMNFTSAVAGIYGGRKKNPNENAKGRWTGVYRIKHRGAAITWLERHKVPGSEFRVPSPAEPMEFAFQ